MGRDILIQDLQARGRQKAEAIWQEARDELAGAKADCARHLAAAEAECCARVDAVGMAEACRLRAAAQRQAAIIATEAEQELADRLYTVAMTMLHSLRGRGHEKLFSALARELPPLAWQAVSVHPEDLPAALDIFPEAHISEDASICAGFIARTQQNSVEVVNTLENRLARAWPALITELLQEWRAYEKPDNGSR